LRQADGTLAYDNFQTTWVSVGTSHGKLRPYSAGSRWVTATEMEQQGRMMARIIMDNYFRAMDIAVIGNSYFSGIGPSAEPRITGGADSLVAMGIRLAQYCMIFSALRPTTSLPLGGQANSVDSFTRTGNVLNGNLTMGMQPWNPLLIDFGENCGGNVNDALANPVFPNGSNYLDVTQDYGEGQVTDHNCGAFSICTALQGVGGDDLNKVLVIDASWLNGQLNASQVMAQMLMLFCPGPMSLWAGVLPTTDIANGNAANQLFVLIANMIFTQGITDIIFLVPTQNGAIIPLDIGNAQASSSFQFQFGPRRTQNTPAFFDLQISPIHTRYYYPITSFVRSWSDSINANTLWNTAKLIWNAVGRRSDIEMGVSLALACSARLRPMMVAASLDNCGTIPNINIHSRDTMLFNATRPTMLGNDFPVSEPQAFDFAVPTLSASWFSACVLGCIVPEAKDITLNLTPLLTRPECWQMAKYFFRSIAIGYQMFYTANQKPVVMWNNAIYVRDPANGNEVLNNNIMQVEAWRRKQRRMYAESTGTASPLKASAAIVLLNVIAHVSGVSLPKDSWGNTFIDYLLAPIGTLIATGPTGGNENLFGYVGLKANLAGTIYETTAYIATMYTDVEIYSICNKIMRMYSQWPQPYTGCNYGLYKTENKVLSAIITVDAVTTTWQTLPNHDVNAAVMGSMMDIRNSDDMVFAIRNLQASLLLANTISVVYNDFSAISNTIPRLALFNNGVYSFNCSPQRAQGDLFTAGTPPSSVTYYMSTPLPAVDITGRRWYPAITNANIAAINQWFSKKLHLAATTLLFNRPVHAIQPIIGEATLDDYTYSENKDDKTSELKSEEDKTSVPATQVIVL